LIITLKLDRLNIKMVQLVTGLIFSSPINPQLPPKSTPFLDTIRSPKSNHYPTNLPLRGQSRPFACHRTHRTQHRYNDPSFQSKTHKKNHSLQFSDLDRTRAGRSQRVWTWVYRRSTGFSQTDTRYQFRMWSKRNLKRIRMETPNQSMFQSLTLTVLSLTICIWIWTGLSIPASILKARYSLPTYTCIVFWNLSFLGFKRRFFVFVIELLLNFDANAIDCC